jgi:hypothetical protein
MPLRRRFHAAGAERGLEHEDRAALARLRLDDRPRRRAADLLVRRQQQDNAMPALTSGLSQTRIASMAIAMPAFMS